MKSEISVLQVEKRIRTRVKGQVEKTQREYFLNEQMKAIQKELGDEDGRGEFAEIEDKIKKTKLSKEAREKATHELKKLRLISPMSAEGTVVRNYLDWLLAIPWNKKSKTNKDLVHAQQILDHDHYGLEKVKERIVEYLAVQQRANKLTGPILCLVGPPGVGKTSLGKSIAHASGRDFVHVSLGGELLTIEAAMMPGKGRMMVTGNLRDVMKESISAAAAYVRSRAVAFGIEPPLFDKRDIHVHVPEGATPKDGPSAGVAMVTAIVSVMTGIPVRRDVAMAGEITLRGRVWPIAGLKEKLLAALRGGIKTVLIPEENAKDLVEIADSIKSGLEIVPVSRMDEVLARAMTRKPEPIEWDETTSTATAVREEATVEEEASTLTAH